MRKRENTDKNNIKERKHRQKIKREHRPKTMKRDDTDNFLERKHRPPDC